MNDQELPFIPIVGVTAYSGQDEYLKCIEAGMDEVLVKPINLDQLKSILILENDSEQI